MFASISLAFLLFGGLPQADERPIEKLTAPDMVTLPMLESARRAPVIALEIGGKEYRFALDTGAVSGRISKRIVDELGLKPIGKVRAGDPSGKNTREVSIYRIPEIKAGEATLQGVRMFADDGVTPAGSVSYFDGVIGYAVFAERLLTLDYPNRRVLLRKGALAGDALNRSILYTTEHGIPVLPVQIGNMKTEAHVDSGADGGLSIPDKLKAQLSMDGEPFKVGTGRTLFNTVDIMAVKVKEPIFIGGMKIDLETVELNSLFPIGNIGGRVLSKYKVTIDQKQKRILFE